MEVTKVSPDRLKISDLNERKENIGTSDLEESVREQGVIQPPLVRENGSGYEVVVGQRRTLAAQSVGLDEIQVFVADWDDVEALKASITENIDLFQEEVPIQNRAKALEKLWIEMGGEGFPSDTELSRELGDVPRQTINDWLEPLRDDWEGTVVDPDRIEVDDDGDQQDVELEEVGETTLRKIRQLTEGGEEGEELVKKVAEGELTQADIREVKEEVEAGSDLDEVVKDVEKDDESGDIQVRTEVTFTGSKANAIDKYAKDRGMSKQRVVRRAIEYYLENEGYI